MLQHAEFTATLGHFDLQWGYPQFTVDATNTTDDRFVTPWHGGHTNPSGLTFTSPGVYAVNFIATHTRTMTGRSMLSIEDPQTSAIIGRQNAQTGEDSWSLAVPNLRTTTPNKRISFGSYKHNGSSEPAAFRIIVDRMFAQAEQQKTKAHQWFAIGLSILGIAGTIIAGIIVYTIKTPSMTPPLPPRDLFNAGVDAKARAIFWPQL